MKPTHRTKGGEKICYITIKQRVDADAIETAIMKLMDNEEKVTKSSVTKKLKNVFYYAGSEGIRGVGTLDDGNWNTDDVEGLIKRAIKKSKQLFPDFYNQKLESED